MQVKGQGALGRSGSSLIGISGKVGLEADRLVRGVARYNPDLDSSAVRSHFPVRQPLLGGIHLHRTAQF